PCGDANVFSTFDPSFGLVRADGTSVTLGAPRAADMGGKLDDAFTVSADGTRVRFGLAQGNLQPVLFDLSAATLVDSPSAAGDLRAADVASLNVANWANSTNPTVNGR